MNTHKLHIAIPLMNEYENIDMILSCLRKQTYKNFKVWFCVNQPEEYRYNPEKFHVCENNAATINKLKSINDIPITLIDRSSKGNGWQGKNSGVGIARKVLMDAIAGEASAGDIIVSLDGDTSYGEKYFGSLVDNFNANPEAAAISVPYYHQLTGNEKQDRAILRYEIYMRTYERNMHRIASPYAFTALGSAIACRVSDYTAIGGMTPKKSGEDFYFLQKIAKYKPLLTVNAEKVYPAARFSDRVFFGTGPAMIKGAGGDWSSYPVYRTELFDEIAVFYGQFKRLFYEDFPTVGDEVFGRGWAESLRANATNSKAFTKACHHKFDGLRILQFLKQRQKKFNTTDEENLIDFFKVYSQQNKIPIDSDFSFAHSAIEILDEIRNLLIF